MMKINLGCGTNRLKGWSNFDADIDITQPLPFDSNSATFMFAEHVVEHVEYVEALAFFKECYRVLRPDGVLRIAVPSIERILHHGNEDYYKFAAKWAPTPDLRGAMHAILFAHGHRAPWTESLLVTSLFFVGFDEVMVNAPGLSPHPELQNVEGHGKVISDEFNLIETSVAEATKQGV